MGFDFSTAKTGRRRADTSDFHTGNRFPRFSEEIHGIEIVEDLLSCACEIPLYLPLVVDTLVSTTKIFSCTSAATPGAVPREKKGWFAQPGAQFFSLVAARSTAG